MGRKAFFHSGLYTYTYVLDFRSWNPLLATAHEPHFTGHRKLHQPSELGPLSLLKKIG
jgi:hypothetical protein